jgi:pentatricopeptide repeat protein
VFQKACGKGNNWRKALDLMDEMKQNNVLANQFTYSAAISACGNGGQWERALELLNQVRHFSNGLWECRKRNSRLKDSFYFIRILDDRKGNED